MNLRRKLMLWSAWPLLAAGSIPAMAAPTVSMLNPPFTSGVNYPHYAYNGTLSLQANAVDSSGASIVSIEFFEDGIDMGPGIQTAPGTYSLTISLLTIYNRASFTSGEELFNFYAVATNTQGQTGQSLLSSIDMDVPPTLVLPQDLPVGMINKPYNTSVVFQNSYGTVNYTANGLPNGLSINAVTGQVTGTPTQSGTFNVTFAETNIAGIGSGILPITIQSSIGSPAIVQQPLSQNVNVGQSATFSVSANGTPPLTYQWFRNGSSITGATNAAYGIPATTMADNGAQFTVTVNNAANLPTTSGVATLTVITPSTTTPVTIIQPPVSQSVNIGQTATFSVTANGTPPLSYQWFKSGTAIAGANASSYITPAAAASDNGTQFSVTVNNSANRPVTSGVALLFVSAVPAAATPTLSPNGGVFNSSVQVTLACATAGAQIRYTTDGSAPTSASTLYNGTSLKFTVTTVLRVMAFASGLADSAEANASFVINQPPAITQQPISQSVTVGQSILFSVTASGTAPLTYQWLRNGSPINGATAASFTLSATSMADNSAQFSVTVNNATLLAVTSNAATLTVNALPSAATPTISPNGGTFSAPVQVMLACATTGAQIRYTTDGSAPTAASSLYSAPFTLSANTTLQVMAFASGLNNSAQASASFVINQPSLTASLTIGSANASPGGIVTVPVLFKHGPTAISGIQFNLTLPPGISTNVKDVTVASGPAATLAGKAAQSGLSGTTFGVIVFGFNSNSFSDTDASHGDIADITLHVTPDASGILTLPLSTLVASDPQGHAIPLVSGPDGSITVSGASAPAQPSLQVGAVFPVDGSMALTYAGEMPVTFEWTFTPESDLSQVLANAAFSALPHNNSFSSANPTLSLAPLALAPGHYHVQVVAVNTSGQKSLPADADITLVAQVSTELNAVKIFPNPWRADHPMDGIHFEGLPDDATIKIFTVSAHWVRTLSPNGGKVTWDLRNDSGDSVASGLYVYLITDNQGGKNHGKLAIIK